MNEYTANLALAQAAKPAHGWQVGRYALQPGKPARRSTKPAGLLAIIRRALGI